MKTVYADRIYKHIFKMGHYEFKKVQTTGIEDTSDSRKYFYRQILVYTGPLIYFFVMGMCFGGATVMIPQIRKEENSTIIISETTAPLLVTIYSYAAIPWIIILPMLATFFGRKKPFIFVCAVMLIASIAFYVSTSITEILISEAMEAVAKASIFTLCSIVLTEYTYPKYRGFFLTFQSATLCSGIWLSNAIGTFFHWRYIGLVKVILSTIPMVLVFFWPESPYWLASKGRYRECAESHRWLKGSGEDSELELQRLIKHDHEEDSKIFWRGILQKEFYKPTLIGLCSIVTLTFSGKIACAVYSLEIIKKMTSDESAAYTAMLILDGVVILAMYIGTILSRYMTRRVLYFSSTIVGIVSLYALSLHVYLVSLSVLPENKFVSLALLSVYLLGTGCGPTLFAILFFAELLPLKNRSFAMSFVTSVNVVALAVVLQLTPIIIKHCGLHSVFLFFAVSVSIFTVILYFYLPEMKDKTLHEIADDVRGSNSLRREQQLTQTTSKLLNL